MGQRYNQEDCRLVGLQRFSSIRFPDGNNQKVVIQITANNNTVYEAYLNSYEDYRDTTDPMLVTIPFSEFAWIPKAIRPGASYG